MIKLYEIALSGNCHKVRMLLSMLGIPYESVPSISPRANIWNLASLALSPFGEVPALVDGDVVVRDSNAILVYLASRYGGEQWWPGARASSQDRQLALNRSQRNRGRPQQPAPCTTSGAVKLTSCERKRFPPRRFESSTPNCRTASG